MIEDRIITSTEALRNCRRVVRDVLPSRWLLFAAALVCMVGVAYFTAALAATTKRIVDDVFVNAEEGAAIQVAVLLIAIAAARGLFTYANSILSFLFNRSIAIEYQKRLFEHTLGQDLSFFAGRHAPQQMSILQRLGRSAGKTASLVTNKMIVSALTLASLFWVMIQLNPMMTLICSILIPLIFGMVANLAKRIRKASKEELALAGQFYATGTETLEGIKTVKSFALEEKSIGRFEGALDAMEERTLRVARISAATVPLMELLGGLVIGLFVLYGAQQAISGTMTPGEITAFITAFLMAYQPAERLSKLWVDLQKEAVLVTNMYAILDRAVESKRYGNAALPQGNSLNLTFDEVSFSYGGDAPAIQDVSFQIPQGQKIAVVGRSGAGKSTFVDLLLRFCDPQAGAIRLGETNIKDLSQAALHDAVAFVSQDIFLFDGTLADNIADGQANLSQDDIAKAAQAAQLGDVIASHPQGLRMPIGPNGSALSGGQRQRLGIARGIAKRAKIYVFDEATSALDAKNERLILSALGEALPDATLLFVTHRPATLAYVDRVLMLEAGQLVGFDSTDRLLESNDAFKTLFANFEAQANGEGAANE